MSKKENFNQAVFDMFGVGKGREKDDDIQRDAISSDAPVEPVVEPVSEMVLRQNVVDVAKPMPQACCTHRRPHRCTFQRGGGYLYCTGDCCGGQYSLQG